MSYTFNEQEVINQFLDALKACGCEPQEEKPIIADGKIHRFPVKGDRNGEKAGAYCLYSDEWPAGWFCNWRTDVHETWCFKRDRLDDAGREYFNDERYQKAVVITKERREQFCRQLAEERKAASAKAAKLWSKLSDFPTFYHPYLEIHKVGIWGIKLQTNINALMYGFGGEDAKLGELVIPLRDINGNIQSLQFIFPDGSKRFFEGAPVKGAFFSISLNEQYLKDNPNDPILICEGYATAATIYQDTHMPTVAAMNAGNIYSVAQAIQNKYTDHKIIIMADNDRKPGCSNTGLTKARKARDELGLQAVIFPPFKDNECGSDWNDYEALYGMDNTQNLLMETIRFELLSPEMKALTKKVDIISAQNLRNKGFKPINWVVPGLIPEGFTVLAGGPKVGKSILALHLALGVAIGGRVLSSIDVEQGDVLYFALEDTQRRLKERINGSHIDESCNLSRLDIVTSCPRQDEGGLDFIKLWLSQHPQARLVIVDTLQKFRKQSKGKLNVYAEDYDTLAELKQVADEFHVAFIVIHHLKKMSAKEELTGDWINQLSGSMGISGCADTIISLRRERSSTQGTLRVTGRDVEERTFSMKLDGFGWILEGETGKELETPAWQKVILEYLQEHEKVTPMQLSEYAHISIEAAKKQLQRATDSHILKRIEHGVYALV